MSEFKIFEFTDEILQRFREKKEIPAHLYNRDGQILIYKKESASDAEIERILRFVKQGIYYNTDDSDSLGIKKSRSETPDGLTDTKLLTQDTAASLTEETKELFNQLRQGTITAIQAKKTTERMSQLFNDFENQPDAMTGLVNIIELMTEMGAGHDVELAVKRTVVAMAMKTRGMQAQSYRDKARLQEMVNVLMTSALLCDIGYAKMKMPVHQGLSFEEMNYVRNHPLMSYMMIAHEREIDPKIKRNILCHHRPLREGMPGNNYPDLKWMLSRLGSLLEKYQGDSSKSAVVEDIKQQILLLKMDLPYDEDANIIAIASEFASLTNKVPWRKSFSPERAVKMIVNNSYFTYSDRIVREFLDYVSISLCDNRKIIKEGDYIIVTVRGTDRKAYFEVCQVTTATRYQSKPGVDRFATIYPDIEKTPKMQFMHFNLETLKPDPRHAHYELSMDDSRHIVYIVDEEHDAPLFERLQELTAARRARHQPPPEKNHGKAEKKEEGKKEE